MISAALELRFDRAITAVRRDVEEELTVEVVVSDVHVIDPLVGEARGHLDVLLLHLQHEGEETFDVGRWDIVAVGPLDQGLGSAMEGFGRTFPLTSRMATGVSAVELGTHRDSPWREVLRWDENGAGLGNRQKRIT